MVRPSRTDYFPGKWGLCCSVCIAGCVDRALNLSATCAARQSAPLDFGLRLPTHIRLISIVGFPLRKHLTNGMARRCHRQLTLYGPNDGGLILADVCALPGLIYPIWGGDHYLRSGADMKKLIGAVVKFVGQEVAACPSPHSTGLVNRYGPPVLNDSCMARLAALASCLGAFACQRTVVHAGLWRL